MSSWSPEHLQACIQKGMALLDEKIPGWIDRVNVDKLELSSPCHCILGQVQPTVDHPDPELFEGALLWSELERWGFGLPVEAGEAEWDWLTFLWKEEIVWRRGDLDPAA